MSTTAAALAGQRRPLDLGNSQTFNLVESTEAEAVDIVEEVSAVKVMMKEL